MAQLSLAGTSFVVTADRSPRSFNASFDGLTVDGWLLTSFTGGLTLYAELPRSPTRIDFAATGLVPPSGGVHFVPDYHLSVGSVHWDGARWVMSGTGLTIGLGGFGLYSFGGLYIPPPPNDTFAGRIALSGLPVSASGSNIGSSTELFEPNHANRLPSSTIWWSWTPPMTGRVEIDTFGSTYDTTLAVYTGNSLVTLQPVAANLSAVGVHQSHVRVDVVAGVTYQIVVGGDSAAERGATSLNIATTFPVPANDNFADRIVLTGLPNSSSGSNVGAVTEPGEPSHGSLESLSTVWWTWTAPASQPVLVDLEGTEPFASITVYTGDSLATLVEVGTSPGNERKASRRFEAVAGVEYQIVVHRTSSALEGALQLNMQQVR